MKPENFIMMPIPSDRFTDVCALLGGAALAGLAATPLGNLKQPQRVLPTDNGAASQGTDLSSENTGGSANGASDGTGATATTDASPSDGEIDAGGHPWSADLHASTKGKTKDGFWRMKVGVSRPDPLPGFPKDNTASTGDTGTSSGTEANSATSQTATDSATAPTATSTPEATAGEDDEFAAFRAAAAASDATDAAAAAGAPARQYSDADLGALCNQAAVKLGDPSPIKEIIASYIPEGQVAHSRNIPTERRADFVKAVEDKAGIQFAG